MKTTPYKIKERVWLYKGDAGWHFITIKKVDADEIKKEYIWPRRGFGAIPVNVTLGKTKWKTSIFPDKNGEYVLPIKKLVRVQENLRAGSLAKLIVKVAD